MVHNRRRRNEGPREVSEDSGGVDTQRQIRRAMGKLREAQEILAGLIVPREGSMEEVLQDRADALGAKLTRTELEVMARFVEGQPPGEIAEDRGLSERTVDNQLRVGCHKLGFRDRREMKGWAAAANQFLLSQPPDTE